MKFQITDNILRLICFSVVGVGLLISFLILNTRGVKWIDKEEGKVRGHAFAFVGSFLFLNFLFLGFIFDFVATAWDRMGDWVLYGYGLIMFLFAGTNAAKLFTDYGLKKADLLNKVTTAMKETKENAQ